MTMTPTDVYSNQEIRGAWKRFQRRGRKLIEGNPFIKAFERELRKNLGPNFKLKMKRAQ